MRLARSSRAFRAPLLIAVAGALVDSPLAAQTPAATAADAKRVRALSGVVKAMAQAAR